MPMILTKFLMKSMFQKYQQTFMELAFGSFEKSDFFGITKYLN